MQRRVKSAAITLQGRGPLQRVTVGIQQKDLCKQRACLHMCVPLLDGVSDLVDQAECLEVGEEMKTQHLQHQGGRDKGAHTIGNSAMHTALMSMNAWLITVCKPTIPAVSAWSCPCVHERYSYAPAASRAGTSQDVWAARPPPAHPS